MMLPNDFEPHNTRALDMWEQIREHVNFNGKTVCDYGCGGGDFAFFASLSGADYVVALDKNKVMIDQCRDKQNKFLPVAQVVFIEANIESHYYNWDRKFDVGICFSVLSYFRSPLKTLRRLSESCKTLLFETQYYGDGPGLAWLPDDETMKGYFELFGFETVETIGRTHIKDRDKYRTIWKCQWPNLSM
jgi:SAM-dependent methyltransferase